MIGYTILPCRNTDVHESKGEPTFSPLLLTTGSPFSKTNMQEIFFMLSGKILYSDFPLKPWQSVCCRIIFIASGDCRKGMPIILSVGRKSRVCSPSDIYARSERVKNGTHPACCVEKQRYGSGGFGNIRSRKKTTSKLIWIIFITIR